jgi:hypothetical protein
MENVANPANVTGNTYILSGIFFDSTGTVTPNLAVPQTAYVESATDVVNRWDATTFLTPGSTDVGSEWAFRYIAGGFVPVPYSPHYGIGSAGFSAISPYGFGAGDIMDPTAFVWNAPGGTPPDGGGFGLVPTGFTGYGGVSNSYTPFIVGPVHFVLSVPEGFDPATAIS